MLFSLLSIVRIMENFDHKVVGENSEEIFLKYASKTVSFIIFIFDSTIQDLNVS